MSQKVRQSRTREQGKNQANSTPWECLSGRMDYGFLGQPLHEHETNGQQWTDYYPVNGFLRPRVPTAIDSLEEAKPRSKANGVFENEF